MIQYLFYTNVQNSDLMFWTFLFLYTVRNFCIKLPLDVMQVFSVAYLKFKILSFWKKQTFIWILMHTCNYFNNVYSFLYNFIEHGEKRTVESTDVICWNRDSSFFCNIYRFFCWIHRLFVNSTDEPVKSTDMSVRIADFKKKRNS